MPYKVPAMLRANELLAAWAGFEPAQLLEVIGDAQTVRDGVKRLGLLEVLEPDEADATRTFLAAIPAGLDAAIVAGVRSALERGLRVAITWQAAYEFELRVWEVSAGSNGMLNLALGSPYPEELAEA